MEAIKIRENFRQTKLKAEEIQLFKNSFVIVPYQVSGFIDYTNRGATSEVVSPNDFETFKRVWTGNDACVISWKDSIKLVQNEDTKEMEIKYQLGSFFLGTMETNSFDNDISKDQSFSEYTSQQQIDTFKFRVDKTFEINSYYNFMFYKIPELSGSTLYRIEYIEKDYVGLDLIGYVISFKTINQELANTGRARQQNIMPSAPGQGYLECIVKDSNWPNELGKEQFDKLVEGVDYYKVFDRYVVADKTKIYNNPIKRVVVKLLGNGILNSFVMTGRPVGAKDTLETYRAQRPLFAINFSEPSTPTLFNSQNNNNNYYFGDFKPTLEYFKDLMSSIKDSLTPINQWKYQGWLTYNYSDLKNTNPIDNGQYKYNLYGQVRKENNNYIRDNWVFEAPPRDINTTGQSGLSSIYKVGGRKNIHDHLFDNFWTSKQIKALPISKQNTLTFGSTVSGGIGGAVFSNIYLGLALLTVGIGATLITKLLPRNLQAFSGIINASFLDFTNDLFKATDINGNKIPFNVFDNDKESPSSIFYDSSTLQTSFEANITDQFYSNRVKDKNGEFIKLNTLNIGQRYFENGDRILPTGTSFLLNGDTTLIESEEFYNGFIIDSFKIAAIGSCEISVEFLDINGDIAWSGIYQSEAKWTSSLREIWTEKNCSVFGRENIFYQEPVPYPKPLPEPPTDIITGKDFEIPINYYTQISYHLPGGLGQTYQKTFERITKEERYKYIDDTNFGKTKKAIIFNNFNEEDLINNYEYIQITRADDNKPFWTINVQELVALGEVTYFDPVNPNDLISVYEDEASTSQNVSIALPWPTGILTTWAKALYQVDKDLKVVYDKDNKQIYLTIGKTNTIWAIQWGIDINSNSWNAFNESNGYAYLGIKNIKVLARKK